MTNFHFLDQNLLESRNLIEASAGTGKTYSIALLFLRLLLEKEMDLQSILTVTFTNAAAEELKGRVRQFIRDAYDFNQGKEIKNDEIKKIMENKNPEKAKSILNTALLSFDDASIFTIHGFCQRILIENSFESGTTFGTELIEDDSSYRRERTTDFFRQHLYQLPAELLSFLWSNLDMNTMAYLAKGTSLSSSNILPVCVGASVDTKVEELKETAELFFRHFDEASRVWSSQGRGAIHDLIHGTSMHGTSKRWYNDNGRAKRYTQVETYFSHRKVALAISKDTRDKVLGKFSQQDVFTPLQVRHRFFELIDDMLQIHSRLNVMVNEIKALFLLQSRKQIETRKEAAGVQSFDDLIFGIKDALDGPLAEALKDSLQQRYSAVLIDESQDTDPVQFEIFKEIFDDKKTILFFIGDPKQSIYSFRGADIFAYTDVVNSGYVHTSKHYTMDKNYRSTPRLVEAVNHLFTNKSDPFMNTEITMQKVRSEEKKEELTEDGQLLPPLRIWFKPSTAVAPHQLTKGRDQQILKPAAELIFARQTASEITRLLNSDTTCIGEKLLQAGDIAILVRTRKQGRLIKGILEDLKVPAVFSGDSSVFSSFEATELEAVLYAVSEPGNINLLRGAWITSIIGGTIPGLDSMQETDWEDEQFKFRELHDIWLKKGFFPMFHKLISMHHVKKTLLSKPGGERSLTNLFHLGELLNEAALEEQGIAGVLEYFSRRMSEEGQVPKEYEQRLESDSDAVRITTIHKSKGLEYPVVFCPFLWSKSQQDRGTVTFHQKSAGKTETFLGINRSVLTDEQGQLADQEGLSEAIRLMYVAVTRAVHRCYIFWGKIYQMETSAPAYLFHQNYSKTTSPDALFDELKQLRKLNLIDVIHMPEEQPRELSAELSSDPELKAREFKSAIPPYWRFTSYSGLKHNASSEIEEEPGLDDEQPDEKTGGEEEKELSIINFPKGRETGLAWHEIFETIDFQADDHSQIVQNVLKHHCFSGSGMSDVTMEMVDNVLKTPLMEGDKEFTFSKISFGQRISEMEFYFKLKWLTPERLKHTLGDIAKGLNFNTVSGYMKGFIDLVFEYEGKYYIVDWKSNHLGDKLKDYAFPYASLNEAERNNDSCEILKAMKKSHYILQSYIYTVAVHLYLEQRIEDYDYDRHFGGVFCLFTRGMHPDQDGETGIFRDRPEKSVIEELASVLTGEER